MTPRFKELGLITAVVLMAYLTVAAAVLQNPCTEANDVIACTLNLEVGQ